MQYNTKRGVFGPRGRGGGIFSPALKGLGATFDSSACWDVPGFKSCNTEAGAQAFRDCQSYSQKYDGDWTKLLFDSFDDCKRKRNAMHFDNCVVKYKCSQIAIRQAQKEAEAKAIEDAKHSGHFVANANSLKELPWGVYSFATKTFQYDANDILPLIGKDKITTDGKLGPTTCLAFHHVNESGKVTGWSVPKACAGRYSVPAKTTTKKTTRNTAPASTRTKIPAQVPTQTQQTQVVHKKSNTAAYLYGAASLFAVAGGVLLYTNRKKIFG